MNWQTRSMAVAMAVALGWVAPPAAAQLQEPDFTLQAQELGEGLYMLSGRGGNIAVSTGTDGTFLVDDQYAPAVPEINAALGRLGAPPTRFVLNTHWHHDHTGGNEPLAAAGTVVVAHANVRARMSVPQERRFLGGAIPASPAGALPIVTFDDALTLYLNGHRIRAMHLAQAHTDGDVAIHFEEANVVHAGDLLFNRRYPFIDIDSGGTVEGLLAAVDHLLAVTDDGTRIIPGHGPLATRADLAAYRAMLVETSARVRKLLDEGRDADQIVAAAPNADYDATWAWSFITAERYVRMLVGLLKDRT